MKQTETCSYLCSAFHMCIKPRNQICTQEHFPFSRGYVKLNKRSFAQVTCTVTCAGDILFHLMWEKQVCFSLCSDLLDSGFGKQISLWFLCKLHHGDKQNQFKQ